MFEKLSLDRFRSSSLFEVQEVGAIKEIKRAIASIEGLPSCLYGQVVHFPNDLKGMIIAFDEREVMALVFGDETRLKSGDQVISRNESFRVPVGAAFIGRMVDALGRPTDGSARVEPDDWYPVFRVAPGVMDRVPVEDQLLTGTKIVDTSFPVAKGQRELIIGDRMTGKTTLGVDAILTQKGQNVVAIYCCIGRSRVSLDKVVGILQERGAMDYTIIAAATASDPPGEQFLIPYTAAALGEYLMARGRDVLVVFDDLTRHAWVHRQISLLLQRPPGREAYPGDMFYIHSQLLERAGRLRPELGGGTMTFLPIVEIQQGDVTGHIASNIISITDGQLYLSTGLFNEGFKPAIDFGLSISRIGSRIQCAAMKEVCRKLRFDYLQYKELLRLTRMKSGASPAIEARLRKGAGLTHLLQQDKHQPVSMEEQVILFYALKSEALEGLRLGGWKRLKAGVLPYLLKTRPDLVKQIRSEQRLTPEITRQLDEAFRDFLKFQPPDEEEA